LISHDIENVGLRRFAMGAFISVSFTLTGTLLLVEALTHQRGEILGPLIIVFSAGATLLAVRPDHLVRLLAKIPLQRMKGTH